MLFYECEIIIQKNIGIIIKIIYPIWFQCPGGVAFAESRTAVRDAL